jgi:transcriptional regulator with XRE-family HTH domain
MHNRIRELREARKLTLEEVAERAGTTVQQLSRLERGERRLTDQWMRQIAQALEVRPASLLGDFLPEHRVFAENEQEAHLLAQWRLMPVEDRIYLSETIRRIGLSRRVRSRATN